LTRAGWKVNETSFTVADGFHHSFRTYSRLRARVNVN
jgi:hypothetical protein